MTLRQGYNFKILDILRKVIGIDEADISEICSYIYDFPHQRFGQIICNYICEDYREPEEKWSGLTRIIMSTIFDGCECDPFYEESETTYNRVEKSDKIS